MMRRALIGLLLVFTALPGWSQVTQWTRDTTLDSYYATFGSIAAATLTADATWTYLLPIPPDTDYAAVTIRPATAVPYIAHCTTVVGTIDQGTFKIGLFPSHSDGLFYQVNGATLGVPPNAYIPSSDGTQILWFTPNVATLFASFGTYLVPVSEMRTMLMYFDPDNTRYVWVNSHGITVRVRFGKY